MDYLNKSLKVFQEMHRWVGEKGFGGLAVCLARGGGRGGEYRGGGVLSTTTMASRPRDAGTARAIVGHPTAGGGAGGHYCLFRTDG